MRLIISKLMILLVPIGLGSCSREPTTEEKLEAERQHILAEGFSRAIAESERKDKLFSAPLAADPSGGLAASKASLAELMSEPPAIMSAKTLKAGRYEVSYRRSDGERWSYRCAATPHELMWATLENGVQGPWRGAEEIRYRLAGSRLILTLRDLNGSDYDVVYAYPKLKKLK